MEIILIILTIVLIGAALLTIKYKDLVAAVIASSVVSLIVSIYFYLLQAPDVALTEAAIGVGLSTIIFMITIRRTRRYEE
ncbi:MAG TPA: DUF4040 domain-containing protein [Caldithrix abyssi]|uniref:DUF4040 domain-containing protein n=1 Tax=Caldithrix abyssi TaxID=187145 RepID=A0A7V5UED2_CALAY|nr:DUF4040 domain-containing protein [Caldithrix abyssi]